MAPKRSKNDGGTPPTTPPRIKRSRRRRRRRTNSSSSSSSSSSSEGNTTRRIHKTSRRLTTEKVLQLLATLKGDSSKNSTLSNSSLNNVVPEYDPANRAQTMESWLRKVNECGVIYSWDEKQIIHFSLQKLVGSAKRWFEVLPTVVYSWSEWQAKLRKAFPSEENYGRLLEEMLCRTSRNDESLREYFYDKLRLLNQCEIGGKKAVDCIVHGISDRAIKNGAQALNCSEPEDLLSFLCSQRPQPYVPNKLRDLSYRRTTNRNDDLNLNQRGDSVVCFNCRLKGHPYYKCTKPIV